MPVLPYQQQVGVTGGGTQPFASATSVSDAVGQGLRSVAGGLKDVYDAQLVQQQLHDEAAVNEMYATKFSPAIRSVLYDPQSGLMAKQGADAMSALPDVQNTVEAVRVEARNSLQNERQQRMFDSMARRHIEVEMDGAARHVTRENQVWQQQTSDAVVAEKLQSSVDHYNDPDYVHNSITSGLFEIQKYGAEHGQSAEVTAQRARNFVAQTRTTIVQRMLVDDPLGAQAYMKEHASEIAGPQMPVLEHQVHQAVLPVQARAVADKVIAGAAVPKVAADAALNAQGDSFNPTMDFVFSKEGGYKATDGNSGAPVNFGINQKANPDVDVKNLTKEGAAAIYKDRYWNQIGGDKLPPGVALMAMDAAVNQGVPFAKSILAATGGDVADMANARREQYRSIVAKDPSQAKNLAGWLARVDDAEQQANAAPQTAGAAPRASDMKAQMTDLVAQAEQEAERQRPGDPLFRDMAVQQVKAHLNTIVAGQVAQQQQAHGILTTLAMGTGKGSVKPTSLEQLLADPSARAAWAITGPESQRGMLALLDHNAKEALGTPTKSDPAVVQDTFARIHAPDNDPNKITLPSQLAPLFGKINREDYDWFKKELDQQQSVSGRSLTRDLQNVRSTAQSMLLNSPMAVEKEKAIEAAYRLSRDAGDRVDAYAKAGKDMRPLFTPGNPEYLLEPARVLAYLTTPQQAVAAQARAIEASRPAPAPAAPAAGGIISNAGAATLPAVAPLVAKNPKTGETLVSKDGGKTWTKP